MSNKYEKDCDRCGHVYLPDENIFQHDCRNPKKRGAVHADRNPLERGAATKYVVAVWDDEDTSGQPHPMLAIPCDTKIGAEYMKGMLADLIGTLDTKPLWSTSYFELDCAETTQDTDKIAEKFFKMARGEGYER